MMTWHRITKFDPAACALADRHYSRRKVGSPQFMPPGQTIAVNQRSMTMDTSQPLWGREVGDDER